MVEGASLTWEMEAEDNRVDQQSRTALWRLVRPFFLQLTKWSPKGSTASEQSGQDRVTPSGIRGNPSQYLHKLRKSVSDNVVLAGLLGVTESQAEARFPS